MFLYLDSVDSVVEDEDNIVYCFNIVERAFKNPFQLKHRPNQIEGRSTSQVLSIWKFKDGLGSRKFISQERFLATMKQFYPDRKMTVCAQIWLNVKDPMENVACSIETLKAEDPEKNVDILDAVFERLVNRRKSPKDETVVTLTSNEGLMLSVDKDIIMQDFEIFSKMFEGFNEDTDDGVITIPYPHEVVKEMLRFLYAGKINTLNKNIEYFIEIFKAASLYNMQKLNDLCLDLIIVQINADNVITIVKFADEFELQDLFVKCCRTIRA